MKIWLLVAAAVFGALTAGYLIFFRPIVITSDTVVEGDYIMARRPVVLKGGAQLTIKGNLTVNGQLTCADGPLQITVEGDMQLNGALHCRRSSKAGATKSDGVSGTPEVVSSQPAPLGIALVVGSSATFERDSIVASDGHIQLVERAEDLLTEPELDQTFDEIAEDSGEGPRIGPLAATTADAKPADSTKQVRPPKQESKPHSARPAPLVIKGQRSLVPLTHAQNKPRRVVAGGTMYVGSYGRRLPKDINIKKLPPGVMRVVIRAYFPNGDVEFPQGGSLVGPDGFDGPDITDGCDINVPKQETEKQKKARDALRMRVEARSITIGEYDLYLGDGGRGGNATTDENCDPGKAIAGEGGQSGNFKMTASPEGSFRIVGPFRIHPGKGGNGGIATAYGRRGKDGEVGENGKAAIAVGGIGADNIKDLRALGAVVGVENIYVDSLVAGNGGDAIANPGDGGNSSKCDTKGGLPGSGGAGAGAGGTAKLTYPVSAKDVPGAQDIDGQDGKPIVNEAQPGKDGPPCGGKKSEEDRAVTLKTPTPTPTKGAAGIPGSGNRAAPTATPTPVKSDYAPGFFEFLDASGQKTVALPSGQVVHIIVASSGGNPDIRTYLPIKLEIKVGGTAVWTGTISGDPNLTCRGPDGCSMNGPTIDPAWKSNTIEVKATGKGGELLATYSEKPS